MDEHTHKLKSHCDSINTRIEANSLRSKEISDFLTESLLSNEELMAIFNDWENRMDSGSFSKSMTEMLSEISLFNSDSDLLLPSDDSHFSVVTFWLIERAAFYGSRPEFLRQLLKESFHMSQVQLDDLYPLGAITKFIEDNSKLICSRRFILLQDLENSSVNLSKMIRDRVNEIDTILKGLTSSKDFKYYAQISATWLKSLELLAKLLGKFTNQSAQVNIKTTNIQNYITINTTIVDKLESLSESKKVPKKYIDIIKAELGSELQEIYDVPADQEYTLQKVG